MSVIPAKKVLTAAELEPLLLIPEGMTLEGPIFSDIFNTTPPEDSQEQPELYHVFIGMGEWDFTIVAALPSGAVHAVLQMAAPGKLDPRLKQVGPEGIYRTGLFDAATPSSPQPTEDPPWEAAHVCRVTDTHEAVSFMQALHELACDVVAVFNLASSGEKLVVSKIRWAMQFKAILNDTALYSELSDMQVELTPVELVTRVMADPAGAVTDANAGVHVIAFAQDEYNTHHLRQLTLMLQTVAEDLGYEPKNFYCETAFIGKFYLFLMARKEDQFLLNQLMSLFAGGNAQRPQLVH
jgi:hypothetical protein